MVRSTLVTPVTNYLLTTETGSRAHTAYNAHLVPFYEKHAEPIVDAARGFVADTACPALSRAAAPVTQAVLRVVEPHREKVAKAYATYLGPTVDVAGGAVSRVVHGWVCPSVTKVQTWVVPKVCGAVTDYVVPFYRDTVLPRWNDQVRPAVCRYSKIVVQYTRSEVLPAIADGAGRAYVVSRDFAAAHIVPHAKRATVHFYVFLRGHVLPPVRRVYEQNLKVYVDRVVPWEQVDRVVGGVWVFVTGFAEEFYFMCYTIATGKEHPSVKVVVVEKKTETVEDVGQVQGIARRVSGSARQWIQVARGWVGSAKTSYESRMRANVEVQRSQATKSAVTTSVVATPTASTTAVATSTVSKSATAKPVVAKPAITKSVAATTPVTKSAVTTSAATTSAIIKSTAVTSTLSTTAVAEVSHAEPSTTTEVAAVEDVVKRPDAHVASFAPVDTEESLVESPVSIASPVVEPVEEIVPEVIVAPPSATEVPVVEEILAEQEEPTPDVVEEKAAAEEPVVFTPSESVVVEVDYVDEDEAEEEPVAEQLPVDVPPVLIPEPVISIVEAPVSIPEPAFSIVDTPVVIPEPVVSIVETPAAIPELVTDIVDTPVAIPESAVETPVEIPAPIAPSVVIPEEEASVSPTAEQQTTLVAETTEASPLSADDAASLIYEARDAMAGVLISDDERAVFDDLVKSVGNADKLEEFPSVLNDLEKEDATIESTETPPPVAPLAPQTTVPSDSSGQVDEDVRKAASNWVKDARESISKELAQERTRAGTSDETEVVSEDKSAAEPATPVVASETSVKRIPREPVAPVEPSRRVPAAEKPDLLAPAKAPVVEERIESVKRLKKPAAADIAAGETTKGPRKIKKTKKKVQGSFKRLVEVGRVVLITHGEDAGKIATIVDIVDHNRAVVDGPTSEVKRQIITYKNVVLTDIVVKGLPRTIGTKALAKFLEKEQVVEAWQKTAWAQKLEARKRRANMSDFDRFKLMRLKKQQRDIVNRQSAVLRKERA
ncbi:hypothetical protein H4S07_000524 [Coemansia furcata]|uniref:Uncharacterized protein n=1 Tax=Coemansia furcata TaxID=417177 RepID=A0ACC1LQX5_9FUNG|nr:hypothetical protein H4S07_000524 [Coemansia furcata]